MKKTTFGLLIVLFTTLLILGNKQNLLLQVERKNNDDLSIMRKKDYLVVMETLYSLFLLGDSQAISQLKIEGYDARIIDTNPDLWDYYVIGLRNDSDLKTVTDLGIVLFAEENWIILKVIPESDITFLSSARVFVSKMGKEPIIVRDNSDKQSLLSPPGPEHVVPIVQQMVNSVNNADIDNFWNTIASNPPTATRYSTSQGCRDAATYCYNQYTGMNLTAAYQNWNASYGPNVIATHTGAVYPDRVYIVIGHLDDLPSTGVAPGADDNGSGTVNVLEAAKVMSCYAFKNTVKFIDATGEEQGILGSDAYAADAQTRGEDIRGVINMDMPGWAGDGTPVPENLDLDYDNNSTDLGLLYAACATDYATGLVVDAFLCPSLNASDHYPFWQRGWKAVCGITDNEGYCGHNGSYPYYHTANDTIANCGNKSFFYSVVRTTIATLAELGDPFKIALDKTSYSCNGTITVIVGDRDLNTNPSTTQTTIATIWSTTEATPENVTLTEQGINSMIFKGTISTSTTPPVNGDGLLSVVAGDTITGRYIDALDCNGSTNVTYSSTATTDCTAPIISNVQVINITDSTATITWTTNESANSTVTYGLSTPPGSVKNDSNYVTSHSVTLTGLSACTKYYFSVSSSDVGGNSALDNNGGIYYSFTTYGSTFALGPDDVEGGVGVWTASGTAGTIWHRDICKAHSGTYAWKAGSATCPGSYGNNADVYLTSNVLNLGTGGYHLRFWEWYQTESGYDYCHVQASSNGGGTWTDVVATYAGSNGGWLQRDMDISTYTGANCQVRFWFHSDGGVVYEGWYLDDIDVSKAQPCSAELHHQSHSFTDSCSGGGAGSGNSVLDPGEDTVLQLVANNAGTQQATNVTGTLSTITPGITITDNTASFPNIAAGGTGNSIAPHFAFSVGTDVACGTVINFTVTFNSTEGSWNDAFTILVGQGGTAINTYNSTDVPKPIPDNGTANSTLAISNTNTITDVNVTLNITHTWDGDLTLSLLHPDGTIVTLSNKHGGSGDNYTNTVFDDEASTPIASGTSPFTGSFIPDSALSALDGKPANGTWTLRAQDTATGDTGTLNSWSITLTTSSPPTCTNCTPSVSAPGETSPSASPMTAVKSAGTSVQITYTGNTCDSGHEIYWGSATGTISGSLNWTNTACGLSDTGTATFDPGAPAGGSFFYFVIVGNNGSAEGSYGRNSSGSERPTAGVIACLGTQNLGACL